MRIKDPLRRPPPPPAKDRAGRQAMKIRPASEDRLSAVLEVLGVLFIAGNVALMVYSCS